MTEGEVLHVAVNGEELATGKDRQPDVKDTIFCLRILDDEEKAEVPRLSSSPHRLHHFLLALMENPAAVAHNNQQLAHAEVPAGGGAAAHEQLGRQVQERYQTSLFLDA